MTPGRDPNVITLCLDLCQKNLAMSSCYDADVYVGLEIWRWPLDLYLGLDQRNWTLAFTTCFELSPWHYAKTPGLDLSNDDGLVLLLDPLPLPFAMKFCIDLLPWAMASTLSHDIKQWAFAMNPGLLLSHDLCLMLLPWPFTMYSVIWPLAIN